MTRLNVSSHGGYSRVQTMQRRAKLSSCVVATSDAPISNASRSTSMSMSSVPDSGPSWNVAPQTFQTVVRLNRDTGEREIVMMRWGLIPFCVLYQRPRRLRRLLVSQLCPGSCQAAADCRDQKRPTYQLRYRGISPIVIERDRAESAGSPRWTQASVAMRIGVYRRRVTQVSNFCFLIVTAWGVVLGFARKQVQVRRLQRRP